MKCEFCNEELEKIFLNKFKGTYVKVDGKNKAVCNLCQRKYGEKLKEQL